MFDWQATTLNKSSGEPKSKMRCMGSRLCIANACPSSPFSPSYPRIFVSTFSAKKGPIPGSAIIWNRREVPIFQTGRLFLILETEHDQAHLPLGDSQTCTMYRGTRLEHKRQFLNSF